MFFPPARSREVGHSFLYFLIILYLPHPLAPSPISDIEIEMADLLIGKGGEI
jgi:hypothetical protein